MKRFSQRPTLEILEDRRLLATCHVVRLGDFGAGADLGGGHSRGDLRYCINKANDEPGPNLIDIRVTGEIALRSPLPDLVGNIDIRGPGAEWLKVKSAGAGRVFRTVGTVDISGITITGGRLSAFEATRGAGIYNTGNLTMQSCVVHDNSAVSILNGARGGGIYNSGSLSIFDTTIVDNRVDGWLAEGGGIHNTGSLLLSGSTLWDNRAFDDIAEGLGGGVFNSGSMTVRNTTFLGNRGWEYGGGIFSYGGSALITHTTISGSIGPGINGDKKVHVQNTIVAGDFGDIYGEVTSGGYNVISDSSGWDGYLDTDILDVDPLLGPLQDNGGPTQTMALLPGSPAIDAGDPNPADPPDWDQRGPGFPRIVNGRLDIGAFEVQATAAPSFDGFAVLVTADLEADEGISV